jgi:tryptophan halogenase
MIGHDIIPETWHPIADQLSEKTLGEFLRLTEAGYAADVARMPEHGAYIAKFAPMTQLLRAAS